MTFCHQIEIEGEAAFGYYRAEYERIDFIADSAEAVVECDDELGMFYNLYDATLENATPGYEVNEKGAFWAKGKAVRALMNMMAVSVCTN